MSESEVKQRVRTPSPVGVTKVRSLSPEQQERYQRASEGMRKKSRKEPDFFEKYSYHLVIGGFLIVCIGAFGSTLFKSSKKLSTTPVIDQDTIDTHNNQGYSYSLGPNEFFQNWMLSDAKYILNNHLTFKSQVMKCASNEDTTIIPERYNFRDAYPACAHPVYNQGNCSSSYAITATSTVSDRVCKNRGEQFHERLSPQQTLSCDKSKNFGCNGGSVSRVFDYGRKTGLVTEQCLAFEGNDDTKECEQILSGCEKFKVLDYCVSSHQEAIQREIYKNGPVVAVIPIYKDFLIYKEGVYQVIEGNSRFQQGHAIKLIGWDKTESGQNYWIVENSWGESWGQNGFGWIGTGQANLQFEEFVIAPIVEEFNTEEPKVTIEQASEPVVTNIE